MAVTMPVLFPRSLRNVEHLLHEGEVLEAVVTRRQDERAALKLLRRLLKRYGRPEASVIDKLRSCIAAIADLGLSGRHQSSGQRANNRADNSHLPLAKTRARDAPVPLHAKFAGVGCSSLQRTQPPQL